MKYLLLLLALTSTLTACIPEDKDDTPTDGDTNGEENTDNQDDTDENDKIRVSEPMVNATVSCPLHIEGEARGFWFFEASFPISLVDEDGDVITQDTIMTSDEWMTEDFVAFETDLYFTTDSTEGTLIIHRSNASGLPEFDEQIEIPLTFTGCDEEEVVEAYIRKNIDTLTSDDAESGRNWEVAKVEFMSNAQVQVTYTDGTKEGSFLADYEVGQETGVVLDLQL